MSRKQKVGTIWFDSLMEVATEAILHKVRSELTQSTRKLRHFQHSVEYELDATEDLLAAKRRQTTGTVHRPVD
jgi:hypothetical protein